MILHFDNTELEVQVDDTSYRYRSVKNFHKLVLYYSLAQHVEIPVGAWAEYEGEIYTLQKPSNFTKNSTRDFSYTLTLEYDWSASAKYKLRNPVDGRLKFSYTAKPHEFVQLVVDNMNIRESGWKVGDCIDAVEQVISFNHVYCNDALGQIADAFNTEWDVVGKTIHLRKVEYYKENPLPLAYGRGNGFKKEISRSNQDSSRAVEILYVQGGSENINPSKYGSRELLLPKNKELTYEGRVYVSSADGLSISRKGKTPSTKVEDSLDCSDISPKRIGSISSVKVVNAEKHFYDFTDTSIPNELNFTDCLIEGETMTVIFQSGMLAGKEFDVKYKHTDRRFEIVPQEIDGQTMPNEIFKPVAGKDTYAVFHISLPDSYVCNDSDKSGASWDMFREAARYLYEHEGELFTFKGELDGIWAKKDWLNIGGRIKPGAYVLFSDEQFHQEGSLVRMTGVKDFVNNPHSPIIELSNAPVTSSFSSSMNKVDETEVVVEEQYRKSVQYTKRRLRDSLETIEMLVDAMFGNFSESINPISVQTMLALVGDESLQFRFVSNKTNPTAIAHDVVYNDVTRVLTVPAGIIQHMTLGIDTISSSHAVNEYSFWDMPAFTTPALDDSKRYYLYAKVSKTGDTGEFYISDKAIAMESVSGFYYLWMGVLNSAFDGARSYASLYGYTEILPGRITTDIIVSADGKTYFNLALGEIGGNIKFTSTDGSMKDVADLEAMIGDGNKVHTEQPIPPYKRGDLWVDGKVLRKCLVSRVTGNIVLADWVLAVEYDNTKTTIDGGIVTSGTIQLAGNSTIKAGATGEGTAETSVRFWAGDTKARKTYAPYRVLQSGKLYASDVEIKGKVTATSGEFRGVVYATDGEFTGKVTATDGSFEGDIVAKNFKTIGPFQHTISSLTIDSVMGVISNFPYSFMRVTPSSNNQQLLISRGWGSKYEGRIVYIHNTHNSYNIQLVNGDYLTGILGTFNLQPRGTIQLMWSQASNDWIIIGYYQTPSGWRV